MLLNPPKDLEVTSMSPGCVADLTYTLYKIFAFIVECVVKTYGWRQVGEWIEKNRGKTVLDMITVSDIAYSITIIENNGKVWDQQELIKRASAVEQEKFKNPRSVPLRDREKYVKKLPKYTSRKGRKSGYLSSGWTKEGKSRFNEIRKTWTDLYEDKFWLDLWQMHWEEYSEKTEVCSYWVKSAVDTSAEDGANKEDDDDDVCDDDMFCSKPMGKRFNLVRRGAVNDDARGGDDGNAESVGSSDSDAEGGGDDGLAGVTRELDREYDYSDDDGEESRKRMKYGEITGRANV
jgi:hypothetical protein